MLTAAAGVGRCVPQLVAELGDHAGRARAAAMERDREPRSQAHSSRVVSSSFVHYHWGDRLHQAASLVRFHLGRVIAAVSSRQWRLPQPSHLQSSAQPKSWTCPPSEQVLELSRQRLAPSRSEPCNRSRRQSIQLGALIGGRHPRTSDHLPAPGVGNPPRGDVRHAPLGPAARLPDPEVGGLEGTPWVSSPPFMPGSLLIIPQHEHTGNGSVPPRGAPTDPGSQRPGRATVTMRGPEPARFPRPVPGGPSPLPPRAHPSQARDGGNGGEERASRPGLCRGR